MIETGFSGIDTSTPEVDTLARPFSVLVIQAIDERTKAIRDPLLHYGSFLREKSNRDLVIIGGATLTTKVLVDSLLQLIQPLEFSIIHCASLEDLAASAIPATALVLCVTELDSPILCHFSSERMSGLQSLFDYQRTILWVTQGCQADQPYMNMSVGLGRSLALEFPDVFFLFCSSLTLTIPASPTLDLWQRLYLGSTLLTPKGFCGRLSKRWSRRMSES